MATETITGKVIRTIRHGNTVWGNPMLRVVLDCDNWGVSHRIGNDAGLVYAIENAEFREHAHTFELTRSGRLNGVSVRASF